MSDPRDRMPLAERVEQLLAMDGPLTVVAAGDPVLRHPAEPFDGQLEPALLARFVEALRVTMRAARVSVWRRHRSAFHCGSR